MKIMWLLLSSTAGQPNIRRRQDASCGSIQVERYDCLMLALVSVLLVGEDVHSNFVDSYCMKEAAVKQYVQSSREHIQCLNFNHCYWITSRLLQWAIARCTHLTALHIIECKLRTETLVAILASRLNLTALSFSISSFNDITKDAFTNAREMLKNLKRLHVYYTSRELGLMSYVGEHSTLLDFCSSLEELVIGSAGMAIPELYRPIISNPQNHLSMKVMSITNNIHAGAQMLFYGTLSQLPNSHLTWQTLLMPNVNFLEFLRKSEFRACLRNTQSLQHLDVSGSKVHFPSDQMDIGEARDLRFLSLQAVMIHSEQLLHIATCCTQLTTVNLFGCSQVFLATENRIDTRGIEALFDSCPHLRHLNLGGEHHHLFSPQGNGAVVQVMKKLRRLHSLGLPTCLLCESAGQSVPRGKRIMTCQRYGAFKRHCTESIQASHYSSQESSSSSPQPSASTSNSSDVCRQGVLMKTIANSNPDLQVLELISVQFESAFHKNKFVNPKQQQFSPCTETRLVRDVALSPIASLKCLHTLTLVGVPGISCGDSLVTIAKGCEKLTSLSLAFIGGAAYNAILPQMMAHLRNLKDLRLEQPNLALNVGFFEGLSHCASLQRLCIIAKHSSYQPLDVARLMEQLSSLVVLHLLAGGTITAGKNLMSSLTRRYVKQRPGLNLCIYPLLHDGMSETATNIPAKHFDELTRFHPRVCAQPLR